MCLPTRFRGELPLGHRLLLALVRDEIGFVGGPQVGVLQHHARARVIGEPTLGALNTSNGFFALPDKSSMAVSMGRALETDGTPYPSRVTPDQSVSDGLETLATGRDLPLEAALKALE